MTSALAELPEGPGLRGACFMPLLLCWFKRTPSLSFREVHKEGMHTSFNVPRQGLFTFTPLKGGEQ